MKLRYVIGGAVSLVFGVLLWLTMLGAIAFREGFGGEHVSRLWYVIPALITFGGPILFWRVLPNRARKSSREGHR